MGQGKGKEGKGGQVLPCPALPYPALPGRGGTVKKVAAASEPGALWVPGKAGGFREEQPQLRTSSCR